MLESMWSSMSSSMQLAQDCLDKNNEDAGPSIAAQQTTMEGLERFAQTIDNGKLSMILMILFYFYY